MDRFARCFFLLVLAVVLAACNKPPANTAAPEAAKVPAATAESGTPAQTGASSSGFVLTMDKVDAFYATIAKIAAATRQDPALADEDIAAIDDDEGIDGYVARIEGNPRARQLITSAGMTVREFALTNAALFEGGMAAGMMASAGKTDIPEGIDPQYVRFVQQNKAAIEARTKALEATQ
jgi:hypothetical protein